MIVDLRMLINKRDLRITLPWDVYLDSMGNHSKCDRWIIDYGESCHMNPHREWFN